jgi:hypothetical protein
MQYHLPKSDPGYGRETIVSSSQLQQQYVSDTELTQKEQDRPSCADPVA